MEKRMIELKGVAHFSIPVSDVDKSTKFYTEVVGCKLLSQSPNQKITFLDAGGGVCLLLIKRPAPIHKAPADMSAPLHPAFMLTPPPYPPSKATPGGNVCASSFQEARRRGTIDGPRFYFRDPDGTPLEIINRTHYSGKTA